MKSSKQRKPKQRRGRVRMTRLMLERFKAIHVEIYNRNYPNSPSLAKRFGVDEKTIDRDIEMMRDRMNLPIETDRKKNGYYYDGAVAAFPDVLLTEAEMISMMFATNVLRSTAFAKMGEGSLQMFNKLTGALPESICVSLSIWEEAVSFHYFGEPKFDPDAFHAILEAIANRRKLKMTYETPNEVPAERTMDPLGFAFINFEWVLFSFDYKHHMIRRFVPQRMSDVRETGETFERPADFRVADYLKDTFGVYSSEDLYDVVIQFDKRKAHETRERHWPAGHRLETLPNGNVNMHLKLSHLHDIYEWILKAGGDVFPLQPPEFCNMFRAASKKMEERMEYVASESAKASAQA